MFSDQLLTIPMFVRKYFYPIKTFLVGCLQSKALFSFWLRVDHVVRIFLNFHRGAAPVSLSGELSIIKYVLATQSNLTQCTIVDCGSNRGFYADSVLGFSSTLPNMLLFEPTPSLSSFLCDKYSSFRNVFVINAALSNTHGEKQFILNSQHSQLNSLDLGAASLEPSQALCSSLESTILVQVRTLDEVCLRKSIESILLLKIDVEGAESLVLEGADSLIFSRKVQFIQLEYSRKSVSIMPFERLYNKYHHLYSFSILCSDGFPPLNHIILLWSLWIVLSSFWS